MLNALTALQTNVVATVRRDPSQLRSSNITLLSEQSSKQEPRAFVLESTPAPAASQTEALKSQIDELIAVAQASAQSAAGIEPKGSQTTFQMRAAAAYEQISGYGNPLASQPLLNLAI